MCFSFRILLMKEIWIKAKFKRSKASLTLINVFIVKEL